MPVGNVFGIATQSSQTSGPSSSGAAPVSGSLQANFGPSGGPPPRGHALRSPLGGAMTFSTLCVVGLIFYYWILP